jgi:hypothetical protein
MILGVSEDGGYLVVWQFSQELDDKPLDFEVPYF